MSILLFHNMAVLILLVSWSCTKYNQQINQQERNPLKISMKKTPVQMILFVWVMFFKQVVYYLACTRIFDQPSVARQGGRFCWRTISITILRVNLIWTVNGSEGGHLLLKGKLIVFFLGGGAKNWVPCLDEICSSLSNSFYAQGQQLIRFQ